MRIGLASFLVFAFFLIGRWENTFAQTIKSHKIVTPDTEQKPGFMKSWPYFNFWMEDMVYFFQEKEPLDWQEAKAKFHSGEFELLKGRVFNRGFTESVWWFAFRLENPLDSDITFMFNPIRGCLNPETLSFSTGLSFGANNPRVLNPFGILGF